MALINPALLMIIALIAVAVWFLASFLYKPIGKFIYRIGKDAFDVIAQEDDTDEKEKIE